MGSLIFFFLQIGVKLSNDVKGEVVLHLTGFFYFFKKGETVLREAVFYLYEE